MPSARAAAIEIGGAVALVLASLGLVWLLPDGHVARLAATLPLVLFLPGYLLLIAVFPDSRLLRRDPHGALAPVESVALAMGFSIGLVFLVGLTLDRLPMGITPASLSVALVALTLPTAGAAYLRGRALPAAPRVEAARASRTERWLTAGVIVTGLFAAGALAHAALPREAGGEPEFLLLDEAGRLDGLPTRVAPGEAVALNLVVRHHGAGSDSYAIRAWITDAQGAGHPIDVPAPEAMEPDDEWRWPLEIVAPAQPGPARVDLELRRASQTPEDEPIARLHLLLSVEEA